MADVGWWSPGRRWAPVVGRVAVWVLLVVAATGAVKAWSAPPPVASSGPVAEPAAVDVAAAGLAEMVVAAWLGGQDLDGLAPGLARAPVGLAVHRTTTVVMTPTDAGWTVTVAADIDPRQPTANPEGGTDPSGSDTSDSNAADEVRFYRVAIAAGPPPAVVGLPGQVPSPDRADVAADDVLEPLDTLPPDVVATLDGFASGLLGGSGSLDRYLTTGSDIVAVDPAPFAAVELDSAGVVSAGDDGAVVVVRVVGLDADGHPVHELDYRLDLTRGDRWEVAAFS